jgi:hypothetical protein
MIYLVEIYQLHNNDTGIITTNPLFNATFVRFSVNTDTVMVPLYTPHAYYNQ